MTTAISVMAQTNVDELKERIDDKTAEIKKLDEEIRSVGSLVVTTTAEAKSLQSTLNALDASKRKLESDITVAHKQIIATESTIENLEISIVKTTRELELRRSMVAETVRLLALEETNSPLIMLMGYKSLGEYWAYEQGIEQLQKNLTARIREAKKVKEDLDRDRSINEEEKNRLTDYSARVIDKKKIAEATSEEKKSLLDATQAKEAEYQKLLAQKQKERDEVERELLSYESELHYTLDPSSIPAVGSKVLRWPTTGGVLTQKFGNTAFSKTVSVYNGKGHNGIDIGIPRGTDILSAADGTIRGFGDTDVTCKGASYGKWVLVDHTRLNISTLYAHLSLVTVKAGQTVSAGDTIAYSGNTGYSTGPHLHFSVFAKDSVTIDNLQSRVKGCGVYTLPVASFSGYLNPMSYLQQ